MSLGRSSDGRLFTRDGRICIGCCDTPPQGCGTFFECEYIALDLGCIEDFGGAADNWRISMQCLEFEYTNSLLNIGRFDTRDAQFDNNVIQRNQSASLLSSSKWDGVISRIGQFTPPLACGVVTPTCCLLSSHNETLDGVPVAEEVNEVCEYRGSWDQLSPNRLSELDVDGETRIVFDSSVPVSPLTVQLLAEYMLLSSGSSARPMSPFESGNRLPSGSSSFSLNPAGLLIDRLADAYRDGLRDANTCGLSGGRELVGYIYNQALDFYNPRFSITGTRPDAVYFNQPQGVDGDTVAAVGFPPDEYSVSWLAETTRTPSGFVMQFEYSIVDSVNDIRFPSGEPPFWDVRFELRESGRYVIAYDLTPIGDCGAPADLLGMMMS